MTLGAISGSSVSSAEGHSKGSRLTWVTCKQGSLEVIRAEKQDRTSSWNHLEVLGGIFWEVQVTVCLLSSLVPEAFWPFCVLLLF